MDSNLCIFWETVKKYIPAKDQQVAADHVIVDLLDNGADEEDIFEMRLLDSYMNKAVYENLSDMCEDDENYEDE